MKKKRLKTIEFMRMSSDIVKSTKMGWVGFFDGACPSPGYTSIGALLQRDNLRIDTISERTGVGTSNEAEYRALLALLGSAIKHQAFNLLICGDSMLVLMQVAGYWKIKAEHLRSYCNDAQRRLKELPGARLAWIPREHNELADALSRQV